MGLVNVNISFYWILVYMYVYMSIYIYMYKFLEYAHLFVHIIYHILAYYRHHMDIISCVHACNISVIHCAFIN